MDEIVLGFNSNYKIFAYIFKRDYNQLMGVKHIKYF